MLRLELVVEAAAEGDHGEVTVLRVEAKGKAIEVFVTTTVGAVFFVALVDLDSFQETLAGRPERSEAIGVLCYAGSLEVVFLFAAISFFPSKASSTAARAVARMTPLRLLLLLFKRRP